MDRTRVRGGSRKERSCKRLLGLRVYMPEPGYGPWHPVARAFHLQKPSTAGPPVFCVRCPLSIRPHDHQQLSLNPRTRVPSAACSLIASLLSILGCLRRLRRVLGLLLLFSGGILVRLLPFLVSNRDRRLAGLLCRRRARRCPRSEVVRAVRVVIGVV